MVSKNIFFTFLIQFPTATLNITGGILLTRLLGPEGKGIYTVLQSNAELFCLVFGFSISSGALYFISKGEVALKNIIGMSGATLIISVIITLIISLLGKFSGILDFIMPKQTSSYLFLVYILLTYTSLMVNNIITSVFHAQTNFKTINFMKIVIGIINIITFGTLVVYKFYIKSEYSIDLILIIVLIINFFINVIWIGIYMRYINVLPSFKNISLKEFLPFISFSGIVYIGELINFLNYRFDIWVVDNYSGSFQLGLYGVAVTISQVFWFISRPVSAVMMPYLIKRDMEESQNMFVMACKTVFTSVLILSVAAFFCVDYLIPIAYGQSFIGAILPLKILLPASIFSCLFHLFSSFIVANKKVRVAVMAAISGFFVTIVLDLWLIPIYGILGASFATVCSYFIVFIFLYLYLFFYMKLPKANIFILLPSDFKVMYKKLFA